MAKVREYDFPTGFETSTIPDPGTPSAPSDTVSLGYLQNQYSWGAPVADYTALRALIPANRTDNQIRIVDTGTPVAEFWKYDSSSTTVDDGSTVLEPTDAPVNGRWLKVATSGGSGSGGGSGIETLEQKLENEHYDIVTDRLVNSLGSSFNFRGTPMTMYLLEDYSASSTSMSWAINPLFLNDASKNLDVTTNWSNQGSASGLTTDGSVKKVGTASLTYDKTTSSTNARIRYDYGSVSKAINGYTDLYFWLNLPSITNLTNIEVRIDIDTTNYQTFTATTSHTGASLATGWQLMYFDLTSLGSASGTGWGPSQAFEYFHIAVNTSTSAQTYSGIKIDGVVFSAANPTQLVQVGNTYTIYDTSNVSDLILDATSPRVAGTVTLAAGLASSYTAGTVTTITRYDLSLLGDDGARLVNGLSGAIAKSQNIRLQRILPTSLSSQTFALSTCLNTNLFFKVLTVASGTQVTVSDISNYTTELVSGAVFYVFKTFFDADGQQHFADRGINQTVSSSSASGGITTVNTSTTNTGIAIGDYIVVKPAVTKISLESVTANENFQVPTFQSVQLENLGIQYPDVKAAAAHWLLGGKDGFKLKYGSIVKDLSVVGTPTTNIQFFDGQYAATSFSTSNYFELSNANSLQLSGDDGDGNNSMMVSFWFNDSSGFTGSNRFITERFNSGDSTGWRVYTNTGANSLVYQIASTSINISYSPGQWNHLVILMQDSVTNGHYAWLNAVKTSTFSSGILGASSSLPFRIGVSSSTSNAATNFTLADYYVTRNVIPTQGEIESMYNRGQHRVLGFRPQIKIRESLTALSGQKLSLETKLTRTTDIATPYLTKIGCVQS